MKRRRIKVIWGSSRVVRGRWYLGLFGRYDRVAGHHEDGLAVSIRGVLLWCLALGCMAYVAGATALFYIWERNPYSILSYGDALAYPLRREAIAEKKGQAFIAQGTDLFRARKYHDAAILLRLGLARRPQDLPARLLLARYYLLGSQRSAATRVLEEGLTDVFPGRPYLEAFFSAAEAGEDYSRVVEAGARYAPRLRTEATMRDYRWLMARHFAALGAAGRHEEALALAMEEEPGEAARERRVLALLAVGRPDDALASLREWEATPGADQRTVKRLRVRALREGRHFAEMESAIAELRALNPADPATAVYGVIQRAMAGREAETDAALSDYIFRFGGSSQNLAMLAEPLAAVGDVVRLEKSAAAAAERGYPRGRFHMPLIQLYASRGRFADAKRLLAALPAETGWEAWRLWMQRLIEAGLTPTDSDQLALLDLMRERPWPILVFRRTVEALVAGGRLETARDALAIASRGFPQSAWVQAQGARIAADLAALAAREPVAAVAVATSTRLPGERIFFEQLERALGARQWEDAARMVREARAARPAPTWVATREPGLHLAQVRIGHGTGDRGGMISAAKLFLTGDNDRSQQLLEVARDLFRGGDREPALLLVREVLGRTPNFPPAVRLLAEWEPKPETKSEPKKK